MTGRRVPQPGDGWVECTCGRRHWGLHGAAGLLLTRTTAAGHEIVLQHRALWSDQGGTWGIPGGARMPHENAVEAALREAAEEAGIDPDDVEVVDTRVLEHGPWSYTTVLARAVATQHPRATDPESLEIRWVDTAHVADLELLPAFGTAWVELRPLVDTF